MVTNSPTSPASVDDLKESYNASPVEQSDKKLNADTAQGGEPTGKRKTSQPSSKLSIHPTPYATPQSSVLNPYALAAPPNNERSYLLDNRQRQHERGKRLADALHIIEVRITSTQSKGEARKLRKEAGLLKKKVAESLRQQELITLRLKDIENEELRRNPYWQAESAGSMPYAAPWSSYSPIVPWSPMTFPMMPPIHGPISPLTPLPPGLYHPSPIVPSPLTSPYWLGAQVQYPYQMMGPYVQADPAYYLGTSFEQAYMPDLVAGPPSRRQSLAPSNAKLRGTKHKTNKSIDFRLPQEETYKGRRWSLADTFSPTPKDKRMSIPGLETIWKENNGKEE